ncbi:MAG: hypothetical protein ACR2P9_05870 [Gammaproteobacteria bacterium]
MNEHKDTNKTPVTPRYDWHVMIQTLYARYHSDGSAIPENKRHWKDYEEPRNL